jgi:hypothetical protein
MPQQMKLEFLKFTPGPKGQSQYPDNTGGFDLVSMPTDTVLNQGSNSGAQYSEVVFSIKGGTDVHELFLGLCGSNSIKSTSASYKSMLMFNSERQWRAERTYKEITFRHAVQGFDSGEDEGTVIVTCQYTNAKREAKSFDKSGKARPTVKTEIDLNKGKITTS